MQIFLTFAIEFVAIAGFGSIALHSIWQHHQRFMQEFCPLVTPYMSEVQPEPETFSTTQSPSLSVEDRILLDWLTRLNSYMPYRLHASSTLDVAIHGEVIVLKLGRTTLNRMQAQKLEAELPPPKGYSLQILMGEKNYGFISSL